MTENPSILIAGKDCTQNLSPAMSEATVRMHSLGECYYLAPHMSSLRLRDARNESELVAIYAELMRFRHHVGFSDLRPSAPRNLRDRILNTLRGFLWKLLLYQHEKSFFRQNLINSHFTGLLELQARHFAREIARLQSEVAALRKSDQQS